MEQSLNTLSNIIWNQQNVSGTEFSNNTAAPFAGNTTASFFGTALNSVFPTTAQPVSAFGIPQQADSFGTINPVNQSFRFQVDPNPPQPQSSVFQQNQFNLQDKVVNNTFAHASAVANTASPDLQESSVFSTVSELSQSDIKAFESNTFIFGNIPLKPPTKELCRL